MLDRIQEAAKTARRRARCCRHGGLFDPLSLFPPDLSRGHAYRVFFNREIHVASPAAICPETAGGSSHLSRVRGIAGDFANAEKRLASRPRAFVVRAIGVASLARLMPDINNSVVLT